MTFQITPQHEAIFNWLEKPTTQAAIVEAVAGSGKSSTLQECAKRLTGLVLYLAFNASAVADISARGLPANVSASTLHSCGLRGFPGRTRPQVDGYKSQTIFRKLVREDSPYRELEGLVCSLVAKAKALGLAPEPYHAHALMPDTTRSWDEIADRFNLFCEHQEVAYNIARDVLLEGLEDKFTIDFDDMLYVPVILNFKLRTFAWVMLDEAQDISPIQRALVRKVLAKDGHVIACGDAHQAIYAFRGADSDSLDAIKREFGATSFPLSTTYRCPKSVVKLCQAFVPHFTAHENNVEGEVLEDVKLEDFAFVPSDLVVCRKNAPLVAVAFSCMRRKIPCQLLGKDIGAQLASTVKKTNARTVPELLKKLATARERETVRVKAAKGDKAGAALEQLDDKYATLEALAQDAKSVSALLDTIAMLFVKEDGPRNKVTLSSVHKAKGSEAPRVIVLDPQLMPSKAADDLQQERNLAYVAMSRSKNTLVFATMTPGNSAKIVKEF